MLKIFKKENSSTYVLGRNLNCVLTESFMVQFPHGIMLTLVWSKFITSSTGINHFLMISSTHFKNSCFLINKVKGQFTCDMSIERSIIYYER
jgi:hypothetical protein